MMPGGSSKGGAMAKLVAGVPHWAIIAFVLADIAYSVLAVTLNFFRGPLNVNAFYKSRGFIAYGAGVFFALLAPWLLVFARADRQWCVYALVFTIVVPPAWFFCEYFYVADRDELSKDKNFDHFKYSQDLGSKFWVAMIGLLYLVLKAVHGTS